MESEGFKNVFLTIMTENRVMILACLAHRVEIDSNVRPYCCTKVGCVEATSSAK